MLSYPLQLPTLSFFEHVSRDMQQTVMDVFSCHSTKGWCIWLQFSQLEPTSAVDSQQGLEVQEDLEIWGGNNEKKKQASQRLSSHKQNTALHKKHFLLLKV